MYKFEFWFLFQTAATTTGIGIGFVSPPATTYCGWIPQITIAAAGTDQLWTANAGNLTTVLVSPSVQTANSNFVGYVAGFFQPSANGTLQLGFRSEVSGSSVTVAAGSGGLLTVIA